MDDASPYDEALVRSQPGRLSSFEVDEERPLEREEKLIFFVVLVPMVLALQDSQTDHRIVYLAKGLVVPLIGAFFDQGSDIDQLQGLVKDIHMVDIGMLVLAHVPLLCGDFIGEHGTPSSKRGPARLRDRHYLEVRSIASLQALETVSLVLAIKQSSFENFVYYTDESYHGKVIIIEADGDRLAMLH